MDKAKKITGKAEHHGVQKRKTRDRDGQKWNATGGSGVKPAQKKGYSSGK